MSAHARTDVWAEVEHNGPQRIAASVYWPNAAALAASPPVVVCLPGGGYGRHYFDLPDAGYSQAAYHAAHGMIVVTLDHLSVGDSSVPPPEHAGLHDVAAANHAALSQWLEMLRAGALGDRGPVSTGPVIGVGQSMGGHIAVIMQARHRSFDGVAALGSSMVHTKLPSKTPWREARVLPGQDPREAMRSVDWRVAFHWDDVPPHFVDADMSAKAPGERPVPPWISATAPNAGNLLFPGALAAEAAVVDVPVLIGMGELDVTRDPVRELAAFVSARDVGIFQVPRMAHMHNFAGTREQMWVRVEAFVRQVAALRAIGAG